MKRTLTLSEVSRATGKSRSTVRRALDTGQFPNAQRDDDSHGTWRVPVADLKRLGWTVHDTDGDAGADSTQTVLPQSGTVPPGAGLVPFSEVLGLVDRNSALQSELAEAQVKLARVEWRLEAAERELGEVRARSERTARVEPAQPQRRRWGLRG